MDIVWEELTAGLMDARQLVHVLIRLTAATLLGAVIGIQRERAGGSLGVALLSTVFTLIILTLAKRFEREEDEGRAAGTDAEPRND